MPALSNPSSSPPISSPKPAPTKFPVAELRPGTPATTNKISSALVGKERLVKLLVTGGAGFIGSNFIRHLLGARTDVHIVNFDKLTYAGNPESLADISADPRYRFIRGDISDPAAVDELFSLSFDALVNFAAETHVD